MGEVIRHFVWFFLVSCAVAYLIFLFIGSSIEAQTVQATHIVLARDQLSPGVHHISGMVTVTTTCSELTARTEQVSTSVYRLVFETWEDPSVACATEDTPRPFQSVVFAPAAGVDFEATLDGAPLSIVVLPVIGSE